jgi:hypothetical protein
MSRALAATLVLLLVGCASAPPLAPTLTTGFTFRATGVALIDEPTGDLGEPAANWDSIVEATGYGFPAAGAASINEKRLTAIDAATSNASAKLVEKIEGALVTRAADVKDMKFAGTETHIEVAGQLKGVKVVSAEYDQVEEMATVELRLGLDSDGKIVPDRLLPITPLSLAARKAQAEEAARYDAVAKLREQVGGAHITNEITVRNLMLSHQRARLVVEGMMEGVQFAKPVWLGSQKCTVDSTLSLTAGDLARLRNLVEPGF